MSPVNQRVARVLGAAPLTDARHLLQPLPAGEHAFDAPGSGAKVDVTNADFAVRFFPTVVRTIAEMYPYFAPAARAALDFPRVVAHIPARSGDGERSVPLDDAPQNARVRAVTLIWSLPDLISIENEREAVADLKRFLVEAGKIGIDSAMTVTPLQDPAEAAHRAVTLRSLLRKVGGQAGLRLVPVSGSFASRDIWRTLYSLGLEWGSMDLFHWDGGTGESQFRVLSSGNPPYFLPERAAEGERVPGLILEYDLPRSPDPLAVFDRMAIALSYLRSVLGGRPLTNRGAELDADRLDEERDALQNAVRSLTDAGIAPGSETARRFF